MYREARAAHVNVGPVLQAYLRRSAADARALLAGPPLNVRLCKGIYREPADIAFQDREEIRASYRSLLETFLRGGAYVGIATHDRALVEHALGVIASLRLERKAYEFQMLLGVLPDLRRSLLQAGHRLRVYVPYGAHWYGYSVRRLRENPKIAGYVFRDLLG
jgi:proline dehydrogenase